MGQQPEEDALSGIPEGLELLERLGSGGFGSVYSVKDLATGRLLALKRLERVDPQSIYRFKQEFHLLNERSHPQLVRRHELFLRDGQWSFTMDLIRGVRFDAWVCRKTKGQDLDEGAQTTGDDGPLSGERTATSVNQTETCDPDGGSGTFDEPRLREALRQLVAGVLELHSHGILHRDLKPSNVLVNEAGRLFVLDFGIALVVEKEAEARLEDGSGDTPRLGTPAYMSPEQARGAPLSMASDWYSVGVMLYEVLTGRLPFIGTRADMLRARLTREARDPRAIVPTIPRDLASLCVSLLKRDPFERPSGFSIGAHVGVRPSVAMSARTLEGGAFLGRDVELTSLGQAFEQSLTGRTAVALVHGDSGVGKTAMVGRFTNQLAMNGEATVLSGRCYERETVPFKALDELLQGLSQHLSGLPELEAAGLMPRDVRSLARLFPALGRLSFVKDLGGRPASSDVHELRRRAFSALKELLTRLGDVRPLVLFLDDVHWGDGDSAELLRYVLAGQDAPRLLLVAASWSQQGSENELWTALRAAGKSDEDWYRVEIPVGPLSVDSARELALVLLPETLRSTERAEWIASESERSPLLIAELVRASRVSEATDSEISLSSVFRDRIARLPESARRLLGVLSASERGLTLAEIAQVCALPDKEARQVLDLLHDERLVAVLFAHDGPKYAVSHHKVRRAIRSAVDVEEMRTHDLRLAHYWESSGADPETVAHHYLAAGDTVSGFLFTEKAGDVAVKRSAVTRALEKYEQALTMAPEEARLRILTKLAPTLGRAGLGPASAEVHLQVAAAGLETEEQLRKAGEQYLLAGLTSEAMEALRPVLERYRLTPPRGKLLPALKLAYRRSRLLSRLEKEQRRSSAVERPGASQRDLTSTDLSWTLANGFAGIDVFLTVYYNSVTLWLALDAGDPERIARALSLDAILRALEGESGQTEVPALLDHATTFAERSGSSHARGWVMGARAILALSAGDFVRCEELGRDALELLRDSDSLSFREIGTLSVWFWLFPTYLLGKLDQLAEEAPAIAREAEARGDRYTLSTTQTYILPLHHLVQDCPDLARREADEGLGVWDHAGWQNQHWAHLHSQCLVDLYEGCGQDILVRIVGAIPLMKAAFQLRIQAIRIDLLYLEGRGELEAARTDAEPHDRLARVRKIAGRLRGEGRGLALLYADALDAGRLSFHDLGAALTTFTQLKEQFEARSMILHAAVAGLRVAELSGDDPGAVSYAAAALVDRGVKDARRFSALLLPRPGQLTMS